MEFIFGYIPIVLAYPATLSPPLLLGILLVGVLALGLISDFLGFLILLGLGYLLFGGVTVLMAAFAGGVLPWVLMVLIAAVFFYDFGRMLNRKTYTSFNYHLILLVALTVVFFRSFFLMTWGDAVEWTLVSAVVYIAIGIVVALAKWRGYNVATFDTILDRQVDLLTGWASAAKRQKDAQGRNDARNRGYDTRRSDDEEKPFNEAETAALLGLPHPDALRTTLHKKGVPDELKERWEAYRRINSFSLAMPRLLQSKALFMSWVFGWPGVMMFWVLHDLLEVLTNGIYRMVSSVLRRIQRSVVGAQTDLLD